MKKLLYTCCFLAATTSSLYAQQKHFSMEDAVLGMRTNLAVKNLSNLAFANNNVVTYTDGESMIIKSVLNPNKADTVLTLATLNDKAHLIGIKKSFKSFPRITWLARKHTNYYGYFNVANEYYYIEQLKNGWNVGKWCTLPEKASNTTFDDQQKFIAYTIDNNVSILDIATGKTIQVTNDANKNIVNGASVHRNEFGIKGGLFPSPKGNLLAFYRMDESMVADYPIINWATTPATNENIKYPMAGQTSHQVQLVVFNPKNNKSTTLNVAGPKDQYLTAVTWSPDEQFIYIAVLNREQNHMQLRQYNAVNGSFVKTLFEEANDKYVEPQYPLYFLPNRPNEFLWASQRDGYMHLYRYDTAGKLLGQVTKGKWIVTDILGFNAADNQVLVNTTMNDARERVVLAANYLTGKATVLTKEKGMHNAVVSNNGKFILDTYSNATTPRKIVLTTTNTAKSQTLLTATDPLVGYERSEVRNVSLKADDGTDLYGKLMLPANFDSTKQYPVIVYLYNGPHLQLINNSYPASGNLWYEYLNQRGYIVFSMDGRGSANRGQAFEQAVFRKLGTEEMNDQLKGVDYLKSLPYVNKEKLGVHGWSFGGFMTTSLMLRHPGVFKVGVAGGPVIDWSMYEIMYTERYMDTPQENPKGYEDNNLLTKTKNLKGKLLMIHGAQDDVVVWQHSMKFVKASVDNGVQMDYFVYPGHYHNVQGKDRVHLMQKITDYFDTYLK